MLSSRFRVLITGRGGQLGTELMAASWPASFVVEGKSHGELDIADPLVVEQMLGSAGFDLVINAAAYTAVDQAESEEELAFAVNARGPANLAGVCARTGTALIHTSTDYVFNGTKPEPYTEEDPVSPLCAYGRSKAAGESNVRSILPRHVILRTAWLYSEHGSNFLRTVLRLIRERDELRIVADQFGSPTSARDLAGAIVSIAARINRDREMNSGIWGTYHCTTAGETSWCGFASEIARQARPWIGRRPRIVPIVTADYPTPAARPANSCLCCGKLERVLNITLRDWREALREVLMNIRTSWAAEEARR